MSDKKNPPPSSTFAIKNPPGNADSFITPTGFEPLESSGTRPRVLSWSRAAFVVGVSIFALLFAFLFSAHSLTLNIVASEPYSLEFNGLHWKFGNRLLALPGEYRIQITADGYEPFTTSVRVNDTGSTQVEIKLKPLPGTLTIITDPPGASVTLSERNLGLSPLSNYQLDAGTYEIVASLARYQQWQGQMEVLGRSQNQTLEVVLSPNWAQIRFNPKPSNLIASINGEPREIRNNEIQVLSGEHTLKLSAPGFLPEIRTLQVVPEIDQDLGNIYLKPADGALNINTKPSRAYVTLDGIYVGLTPTIVPLRPEKKHLIKLSKSGYLSKTFSYSTHQGENTERTIILDPELGNVRFQISPAKAELIINGVSYGTGNQSLSLPAVSQNIEVHMEGYQSIKKKLIPTPEFPQILEVTLLTDAEARNALLKPEVRTRLGNTLVLVDPTTEPQNNFDMGSSRRDPGRRANEIQYGVRLEKAFYIAKNETTNEQFRRYEATHDSGIVGRYSLNRNKQPVVGISWQQAASFCNWLSYAEGLPPFYKEKKGIIIGFNKNSLGYRLPSEAEWAFTARVSGNDLFKFSWGNEFPPTEAVANLADTQSAVITGRILNGYVDDFIVSAPVGSFAANHRDLYDMGGNVAEWVHNVYDIPTSEKKLIQDPLGRQKGDNYSVRGGSWAKSRLSELRLTFRDYGERGRDDLGFRIARYAE